MEIDKKLTEFMLMNLSTRGFQIISYDSTRFCSGMWLLSSHNDIFVAEIFEIKKIQQSTAKKYIFKNIEITVKKIQNLEGFPFKYFDHIQIADYLILIHKNKRG